MKTNLKINAKISDYMKKNFRLSILPENIWVDSKDYFDEFPKESLKKNSPLLLSHFSGDLVMVIPETDYGKICMGWYSISSYIKSARWGIGFHWGKNKEDFILNIQWKVLEKNELIENPEKVRWFFKKTECIYKTINTKWKPSKENCKFCRGRCFLRDSENNVEIVEGLNNRTPNVIFVEEIKKRIAEKYGVEVIKIRSYDGKHVWIKPSKFEENKVKLIISKKLLINLMESDDKQYASEKGKEIKIQIRTPENIYFEDNEEMVMLEKGKVVPHEHEVKFLEVYWMKFKVDDNFSNLYAALEEL